MASALLCASHTPLMRDGLDEPGVVPAVAEGFAQLADRVRAFAPDLVIQFAPDHFNGFFYDVMPPFCVGAAAFSIGDWGTRTGALPVPEAFARELAAAVLASDIDIALSYRMAVDHGTTQIWEEMLGAFDRIPIVPIFVNAIAPPLPSYRRARMLGEAVGRHALRSRRRILFAASGGLSHDPPVPQMAAASDEIRARLIDGRNPGAEARAAREARVRAAGKAALNGESPQRPLNPEWDREVLRMLHQGDVAAFDRFDTGEVARIAGCAANETLAWVAAAAAHGVAGPADFETVFYQPITGWIAGMAMMFGTTRAA